MVEMQSNMHCVDICQQFHWPGTHFRCSLSWCDLTVLTSSHLWLVEVSNHQAPAHHMMLLQVSKFQLRWPVSLAAAIWSGTHFVWVGWITLRDEPSGNPFILKDIDCSVRLLLVCCTHLGAWPI